MAPRRRVMFMLHENITVSCVGWCGLVCRERCFSEVIVGVFDKVRWSLENRGLAGTVTSAAKSLGRKLRPAEVRVAHPFDVHHGVRTDGLIPGHDLAVGHANDRFIAGYAAIPPSRFRGGMKRWLESGPAHAVEDYTFIDFGCGKGRAVLLASETRFREVVGVELNTGLAKLAQENAEVWTKAGNALSPIRIVCGDALELKWPEGPCLVYLYNPFGEQVMRQLVEKLRSRFAERPRDLEVMYQKPEQAAVFEDGFEMVWCEAIAMSEEDWVTDPVADPKDESRAYRLRVS
jgi:Methyltransferase domain